MMSTKAIELPLFPLNVVLFPGMVLPLYIYEPRYRQMIEECYQEKKMFGVVLARPESVHLQEVPYSVGTMAEIRDLDRLENGRFTLIASGRQRFRILSQHHAKPYLSGWVEPYEDEVEPEDVLAASTRQAYNLFNDYVQMLLAAVDEQEIHADLPEDPEELSHFIAYFLDIQDEEKQRFLEMTSTQQRLREEINILRREVPFMRQILAHRALTEDRSMLN